MDIAFALDTSESTSSFDFRNMKIFAKRLINTMANSENNIHFGVMEFGENAQTLLNFREYRSEPHVRNVIEKIEKGSSSKMRLDKALGVAHQEIFSLAGGIRQGFPRYLVFLLSDSSSNGFEDIAKATKSLTEAGVTVVAIGINEAVEGDVLRALASDKDHFFRGDTSAELNALLPTLQGRLCHRKYKGKSRFSVEECVNLVILFLSGSLWGP